MSISTTGNKRAAARARVFKAAKIYRMNGVFAMDAIVRDLSDTGCKIVCKDQMALPNEMQMVLPSDGKMRLAKVAWRRGDLAGINFTSDSSKVPTMKLQDGSMF